jgi:hypothetical protein
MVSYQRINGTLCRAYLFCHRRLACAVMHPGPSPAGIESEVTSHVERLNSSDAYTVATWCSTSDDSLMGRGIGFLHAMPMTELAVVPHGIFIMRFI